MAMTPEERAIRLKILLEDGVIEDVLSEMERDVFDQFMRLPWWRRFRTAGKEHIHQIEAIRTLQTRLNNLSTTQVFQKKRTWA